MMESTGKWTVLANIVLVQVQRNAGYEDLILGTLFTPTGYASPTFSPLFHPLFPHTFSSLLPVSHRISSIPNGHLIFRWLIDEHSAALIEVNNLSFPDCLSPSLPSSRHFFSLSLLSSHTQLFSNVYNQEPDLSISFYDTCQAERHHWLTPYHGCHPKGNE